MTMYMRDYNRIENTGVSMKIDPVSVRPYFNDGKPYKSVRFVMGSEPLNTRLDIMRNDMTIFETIVNKMIEKFKSEGSTILFSDGGEYLSEKGYYDDYNFYLSWCVRLALTDKEMEQFEKDVKKRENHEKYQRRETYEHLKKEFDNE